MSAFGSITQCVTGSVPGDTGRCRRGLFGESMGLPVPGESVVMFANFLSRKGSHLQMPWVVLIGITAAVMGDNLAGG